LISLCEPNVSPSLPGKGAKRFASHLPDPAIHQMKILHAKKLDARVKPAHEAGRLCAQRGGSDVRIFCLLCVEGCGLLNQVPRAMAKQNGGVMPHVVIPGRATDLGFTRDRRLMARRSATADLRGASPESGAISYLPHGIPGSRASARAPE
jgi:hypothetical protein